MAHQHEALPKYHLPYGAIHIHRGTCYQCGRALKLFDIVQTMTGGNFGTNVLANEMYAQIFVQFNQGRGSALAVALFLLVAPILIYNIVHLRRERQH